MQISHAHIVAIRRGGVVEGHQLRIDGGGPGRSKFFSAGKHGGAEQARLAAERMARELGLPEPRPRGGSETGRVLSSSTTGAAGIRFAWTQRLSGPGLLVVASWVDRGRGRQTSFSVDRNGLEGALDKAMAARTSAGAPRPDRDALLRRLRREFRTLKHRL